MSGPSTESYGALRRLTAGVLGLAGCVVALLAGMQAGNAAGRVIVTALIAMVVCHVAGVLLGLVIESVVEDHKRRIDRPKAPGADPRAGGEDVQKPRLAA